LLERLGAEAVVMDGLDATSVGEAVAAARPDAIAHEMTAISSKSDLKHMDRWFATTNRLRTEGTDHLLAAAEAKGTVAQPVMAAVGHLEGAVIKAGGAVLRFGWLYGPGAIDGLVEPVRKRQFPVIGDGGGYTSWLHLDDAASATVLALEQRATGVFNIVDDEPAAASEWLPYLAECAGAKPPMRVPAWLARLLAGDVAVGLMTQGRGFSNAKAKRELGWQPRYPSWRQGFKEELA
jgi:hypothetical protein